MCLILYRISYYVEFNMQMCFGLSLFLYFWLRYARRPGVGNVVGFGLAFWLQAVSELYQAVILALSFPFIALPFLPDIFKKYGRSRRLYCSIPAGLVTVIPLCLFYLEPYFSLFHGWYGRKAKEMMAHSLEPLAYLGKEFTRWLFQVDFLSAVETDEMRVFPSLTLLVLVLFYSLYSRRILHALPEKGEQWSRTFLRHPRFVAVVVFVGLVWWLCRADQGSLSTWLLFVIGNGTLIIALLSTIFLAVQPVPDRNVNRLCRGLAR